MKSEQQHLPTLTNTTPYESQGPPPKSTGSKPIDQNGVPDRVLHNKDPLCPVNRYYATGPEIPAGEHFHAPRSSTLANAFPPAIR